MPLFAPGLFAPGLFSAALFGGGESGPTAPVAPDVTAVASGPFEVVILLVDGDTATSFQVERRSPSGSGGYTVIATGLPPAAFPFRNTGLTPSTNYGYQVRGTNVAGNSPYSTEVAATTTPNAGTPSVFSRVVPGRGQ